MSIASGQQRPQTGIRWSWVLKILAISLLVSSGVFYRERVHAEYTELPPAGAGDIATTGARLAAIDDLVSRHPVLNVSRSMRSERSELETELVVLETKFTVEESNRTRERTFRELEAAQVAQQAADFVHLGDLVRGRACLLRALEIAPEDWADAAEARRNIAAIDIELEVVK